MKVEQAFGYNIVRIQCENEELYHNEDLTKAVDHVLNLPIFKNRKRGLKEDSQIGNGLTSVGNDYLAIVNLPGSAALAKWVEEQMLLAREFLKIDKQGNKVKFKRSWANRLFHGAQGKCHQHVKVDQYIAELTDYSYVNFRPDIVGILYVDVPPGSSDLVVINNGKEDTMVSDYSEEDKFYITPHKGELLLHVPEVWHGVTIHNSDLPRNCFVFDADFI
jgi:Putative 2OG-Fe(II) oxygenase